MTQPQTVAEAKAALVHMRQRVAENNIMADALLIMYRDQLAGADAETQVLLMGDITQVLQSQALNNEIASMLPEGDAQIALAEMFERVFQNA